MAAPHLPSLPHTPSLRRLEANKMADVKFTEDGVAYVKEGGLSISLLVDEDGNYEKR